jgi:hypothetical protein
VHNADLQVRFSGMEVQMKLSKIIPFAMAIAATGSAGAAGIGVRAGTTGVGGDVGWGIAPTLSARVGYSGLNYSTDVSTTNVRYDAKLKLSNLSGLLDWSPMGPFRITAGIMGGDNKLDITGTSSGGGSLRGTVNPGNRTAPYLGFGYGNVAGAGVNFYFDIGVIFHGSPKTTLTADCGGLSQAQCTQLQNEAAAEGQRLDDKLNKYKYYPVASIGITIGF